MCVYIIRYSFVKQNKNLYDVIWIWPSLTQRRGPGASKRSKLKVMRWEIGKLASNFNCNDLLFAHAWCGYDTLKFWKWSGLEKLRARADLWEPLKKTKTIFRARKFCLAKKKISLHLHIYSQIGKTIKKYSEFQILSWKQVLLWYFMFINLMVSKLL